MLFYNYNKEPPLMGYIFSIIIVRNPPSNNLNRLFF